MFSPGAYIFHTCDTLSFPARCFLPGPIYFIRVTHFPSLRDTTQSVLSSHLPVELLSICPRPEPLRAQRSGEQASGTRRPASRHLLGCTGNQVFGERLPWLLAGEIVFFHSGGSGSSSSWWTFGTATTSSSSSFCWTFVGLHCEHLPASTEVHYFRQHTMSTSVNRAAGAFGTSPSSGYNLKRLIFIFSMSAVVAVIFAMFISNLSSDKIAHVHIYVTTLLCVIFWIKSNIKMSSFLTIQKHDILGIFLLVVLLLR